MALTLARLVSILELQVGILSQGDFGWYILMSKRDLISVSFGRIKMVDERDVSCIQFSSL